MKKLAVLSTLVLIFCINVQAQTDKEIALQKGREAVKLMDSGKIDESIKLLEEAMKLDPEESEFPYEMGFAYYLKEDYKTAIKYLKRLEKHKDKKPIHFQLLGNAYDMDGNQKKAFEAYDKGLKLDPKAGIIYLSKGIVYMKLGKMQEALDSFEKGIEVNPEFPSNYFWAAKLFCENTEEEVWGMIYGEIFLNLERNTRRTQEISKLLYDTYKNEIQFKGDTAASISFSKMNVINLDTSKEGDIEALVNSFKPPYGMFVYEGTLLKSILDEREINMETLSRIRTRFAKMYDEEHAKRYPNVLFYYQNELDKLGFSDAYNHWILKSGDIDQFDKWVNDNPDKWKEFEAWFPINYLQTSDDLKFYRLQY